MKLKLLVSAIFFLVKVNAQSGFQSMVNPKVASSYTFAQNVETYNEINGGIVLGNTSSANHCFIDPANLIGETENLIPGPGLPIGFDFIFNGNTFDRVAVNTNGWLSFGKSGLGNGAVYSQIATAPISQAADGDGNGTHDMSPNEELRNRVSGLGTDLNAAADSELRIETIGVAPNRTFVAQWENFKRSGSTTHNYNFQIRLNETLNTVEIVYGDMVFGNNNYSAQVGLSGYDQSDYNNRWVSSSASSTNSWANTEAGFSPSTNCSLVATIPPPVSGSVFRWTPTTMGIPNEKFVGLKVYPTVTDNILNINNVSEIEIVKIYDVSGKKIYSKEIHKANFLIDFSQFTSGIYLVNLQSGNQTKTVKVIKK
ncbi:T9SS type A sorting domain-containing protein [Flavobacterium amniphilum]|uniref:T9SS type A sorting domain-containing protein n=1 Tax=Flavobacterium amniphilum TaxID=1834035 RepID=UPI002029CEC9|nr:T9SS type A sorting domain-containing protein [Flavobacterium amniphilum]MCL9805591.1 T9SS type A sorting domain-containing protein [Flavobacterium amniphilum]